MKNITDYILEAAGVVNVKNITPNVVDLSDISANMNDLDVVCGNFESVVDAVSSYFGIDSPNVENINGEIKAKSGQRVKFLSQPAVLFDIKDGNETVKQILIGAAGSSTDILIVKYSKKNGNKFDEVIVGADKHLYWFGTDNLLNWLKDNNIIDAFEK